jgi:hypothetical protein
VNQLRGDTIMALEMRLSCERCHTTLSCAGVAFICSYECTYCENCASHLQFICTNCQGELVRRPRRRDGVDSNCESLAGQ